MTTATPRAELSSIVTALEDLAARMVGVADRTQGGPRDWLATELLEAERPLREATRRLNRALDKLRPE